MRRLLCRVRPESAASGMALGIPAAEVTDPIALVLGAARSFASLLCAQSGVRRLPDPTVPERPGLKWRNLLFTGPRFRRAHVEGLSVPGRLAVLHVCVFPHLDDPAPVFGFDAVGGPARVTGVFMDLSPVLDFFPGLDISPYLVPPPALDTLSAPPGRPTLRLGDVIDPAEVSRLGERREVPSWGGIFSDDFVALRPHGLAEVARLSTLGQSTLTAFLEALAPGTAPNLRAAVTTGQDRYGAAMRRNIHTLRMLARLIGDDPAHRFIEEVLFPPANSPSTA